MSLRNEQLLSLDFTKDTMQTVSVKQYDSQTRYLKIKLFDNGKLCSDLNTEGIMCNIKVKTPDDRYLLNECTINVDNTVSVKLVDSILIADGIADAELLFINEETKEVLSSMPFRLNIKRSVYSDGEILNDSDEGSVLIKLVADAKQLIITSTELNSKITASEDERQKNEQERISNENARIQSESERNESENNRIESENARKSNEESRVLAESGRVEAENTRCANENQRIESEKNRVSDETERVKSESARVSAENERIKSETQRVSDEETRQTNENTRVENENTRKTSEETRQSAENERIANENARKSAETNRESSVADAVKAANNAITEAQSATTAVNENVDKVAKMIDDCNKAIESLDDAASKICDSELSLASVNAVQNKVVTAKFNSVDEQLTTLSNRFNVRQITQSAYDNLSEAEKKDTIFLIN